MKTSNVERPALWGAHCKAETGETPSVGSDRPGPDEAGLTMEIEETMRLVADRFKKWDGSMPPPHLVRQVVEMCQRIGLDPLEPWVYLIPHYNKRSRLNDWTLTPSINWYRAVAEKTGRYQGVTKTYWLDQDGRWLDYWVASYPPLSARKGVYVLGNPKPSWGTANAEMAVKENDEAKGKWGNMPAHMLGKVAERIALQTAFPNEMGPHVSHEEMEMRLVSDDTTPIQAPPKKEIVLPTPAQWDDLRNILAHECLPEAGKAQALKVAGEAMSKMAMQQVIKTTELWAADKVAKYEAAQQATPAPEVQQPETDDDEVVMHHEVPR
jgi:hypothetical protein